MRLLIRLAVNSKLCSFLFLQIRVFAADRVDDKLAGVLSDQRLEKLVLEPVEVPAMCGRAEFGQPVEMPG